MTDVDKKRVDVIRYKHKFLSGVISPNDGMYYAIGLLLSLLDKEQEDNKNLHDALSLFDTDRLTAENARLTAALAKSEKRAAAAIDALKYVCAVPSGEECNRSICDLCVNKKQDNSCPVQCSVNSYAASNRWQWLDPTKEGA